jgi:hypothetical protein
MKQRPEKASGLAGTASPASMAIHCHGIPCLKEYGKIARTFDWGVTEDGNGFHGSGHFQKSGMSF